MKAKHFKRIKFLVFFSLIVAPMMIVSSNSNLPLKDLASAALSYYAEFANYDLLMSEASKKFDLIEYQKQSDYKIESAKNGLMKMKTRLEKKKIIVSSKSNSNPSLEVTDIIFNDKNYYYYIVFSADQIKKFRKGNSWLKFCDENGELLDVEQVFQQDGSLLIRIDLCSSDIFTVDQI